MVVEKAKPVYKALAAIQSGVSEVVDLSKEDYRTHSSPAILLVQGGTEPQDASSTWTGSGHLLAGRLSQCANVASNEVRTGLDVNNCQFAKCL
jgi:hypothetical protein